MLKQALIFNNEGCRKSALSKWVIVLLCMVS